MVALELALKDRLDLGIWKWAKALQGEERACAKGRKYCRRAACVGMKGPGRSEVRNGARRLR